MPPTKPMTLKTNIKKVFVSGRTHKLSCTYEENIINEQDLTLRNNSIFDSFGYQSYLESLYLVNNDDFTQIVYLELNNTLGNGFESYGPFTLLPGYSLSYSPLTGFIILDTDLNQVIPLFTYPPAGIPLSTGSGWGTSIADNSTNWNNAFSWGNHALAGYGTSNFNPTDLLTDYGFTDNSANWNTAFGWGDHAGLYSLLGHTHTFASLTSKPTTLVGYGITDAATSVQGTNADTAFSWGNHASAGYALSSALTGFVPYTGATSNVNLGEYELKAGQVTLDTSPTVTAVVGTTRWNNTIGSSETTLKGGTVILKNGVDLVARVVNKVTPNATLTKAAYQAVRISGAQGQRLAVAYAQANNDNNSADTIGVVCETILTNQDGFILTVGQLEEINTTGSLQGETWADGDVLYLSPTTAGRLTNIKPTGATGHIVVMGYVEYAHAIHGKIYVKIMNGWELDELHNVSITSPANNQGLFYDSVDSLWKNETIANVLGYTPFQLPALTSGSVLFSNGTTIAQDNANLFWDDTNNRLGIGTITPTSKLHVRSDSAVTGNAFLVQNSTPTDLFAILNNGNVGIGISSPTQKLHVSGTGNISALIGSTNAGIARLYFHSTAHYAIQLDPVNGRLDFANNGTTLATLTSSGAMGIGTTTDFGSGGHVFKLSVAGNIKADRIYSNAFRDSVNSNTWVGVTGTTPNQILTIGNAGISRIILVNLPTSSAGLPTGCLWNDLGTVKIV
jgi:nitrogen fixation protein